MFSKPVCIAAAGVCGAFLAYCMYFDQKRRNDPNFKQKLRDKRAKAVIMKERGRLSESKLPDIRDFEAVQKFFIQEVQLGEELLAQGDIENGIEHMSTALAICGEPSTSNLIEVLQMQLPPQVFQLLMQRLPVVTQKIMGAMAARQMQEEDVE